MGLTARFSAWLLLLGLLTACVGARKGGTTPNPSPATPLSVVLPTTTNPPLSPPPTDTPYPTPAPLTKSAMTSCPVTLPNGKEPAQGSPNDFPPAHDDFSYGNEDGTLFTYPWPEGTVIFAPGGPGYVSPDGSGFGMKWPWRRGVPGKLAIEGRRLDAPAPALRAGTEENGDSGFQASGLVFPTQGCWEVTGKVGNARLTFVTLVVKVSFGWFVGLNWLPEGLVSTKTDTSNLPESLLTIYNFSNGGELVMEAAVDERAIITPNPAATQQKVTVQGHPGICVQGALENQVWQNSADAGTLEWTLDGSSYRIIHKGLGLRCEDLLSVIYTP